MSWPLPHVVTSFMALLLISASVAASESAKQAASEAHQELLGNMECYLESNTAYIMADLANKHNADLVQAKALVHRLSANIEQETLEIKEIESFIASDRNASTYSTRRFVKCAQRNNLPMANVDEPLIQSCVDTNAVIYQAFGAHTILGKSEEQIIESFMKSNDIDQGVIQALVRAGISAQSSEALSENLRIKFFKCLAQNFMENGLKEFGQ